MVLVLTGHTLKDADYTIDFHRGTLLTDEEKKGPGANIEAEIDALRRDAITLDATPAAVLAALKGKWDEADARTHGSVPAPPACNLGESWPRI